MGSRFGLHFDETSPFALRLDVHETRTMFAYPFTCVKVMLIVCSVCSTGEECSNCGGNRSDVVDLLQTSTMGRSSNVRNVDMEKAPILPQSGSCPYGYTYMKGMAVDDRFDDNTCTRTAKKPYCILKAEEAKSFCDSQSRCLGISETSDAGWRSEFPGMVQLGSYEIHPNSQWDTCKKWDPIQYAFPGFPGGFR